MGGEVADQAELVGAAFTVQRQFLQIVADCKQPGPADMQKLLQSTSDLISDIQQAREAARRSQMFQHLSAVSESVAALGWVAVAPAPAPYVKELKDAGQFYSNRVLKDYKEKDPRHGVWVRAWADTLTQLQGFVKKFHTTGLVWNAAGGAVDLTALPAKPVITVKHASRPAPSPAPVVKQTKPAPTARVEKAPAVRQEGKKCGCLESVVLFLLTCITGIVEYYRGHNCTLDQVMMNQSVYVYKCENSTIKVNGKVNNIILDSCKKTAVVLDSAVSGCEVMNSQSVQMQILGAVPTIMVSQMLNPLL